MSSDQRRASPSSGAATRDQLIAATQRLLAAGGHQALTSRAITTEAGANLASITYYFGSKDELVTEALVATARHLLEPVVAVLGSESTPTQKLVDATRLLVEILQDHRELTTVYLSAVAQAPSEPVVRSELGRLHRELVEVLAAEIGNQRQAEQLPPWIEPEPMAQLIVATAHGTLVAATLEPEATDPARIGTQVAGLLLAASIDR